MLFDDPALMALKKGFDAEKIKKEGIVRRTERGFGFLEVAGEKQSYFIPPQDMKNVLNGDRIIALITEGKERGKQQASPEELVESSLKSKFVARICYINNKLNINPDNPSIKMTFNAVDNRANRAQRLNEGDWVMCTLEKHGLTDGRFRASIIENITSNNDPKTPWTVSLSALFLPLQAPDSSEQYPFLEASFPREDLTHIPFVTIDSESTNDMDDALYIERDGNGFKLYVAIADPTGYIAEGSALDTEASKRAFSIYLPGRTIPMLPVEMSDNLCSLRENEARPVLVGIISILENGEVDTSVTEFKLATIKSHGKLVYNYVSDYIEKGDTTNFQPSDVVKPVLENLVAMTKLRDHYRTTVTAAFRTRPDYEFVLTEEGALDHIEVNYRRIANQIVEESMIAANIACGDYLAERLNTGIFNTHLGFDPDEIDDAVEMLGENGFKTTAEDLETIDGFCAARRYANSLTSTYLDNMLRKYQQYSEITINPAPHYALGVDNYATWTSPIRKYGDMINHRLLKSLICDQEHPTMPDEDTLITMNCARRLNRMAERSVRDWLYADYLFDDIAKKTVFDGEVFDIVRGGVRVNLLENGAFTFIPLSLFSDERDDIDFDTANGRITFKGEIAFRLGDPIKIRLVNIDKNTRSIVGTVAELPLNMRPANVEEQLAKRLHNNNNRR